MERTKGFCPELEAPSWRYSAASSAQGSCWGTPQSQGVARRGRSGRRKSGESPRAAPRPARPGAARAGSGAEAAARRCPRCRRGGSCSWRQRLAPHGRGARAGRRAPRHPLSTAGEEGRLVRNDDRGVLPETTAHRHRGSRHAVPASSVAQANLNRSGRQRSRSASDIGSASARTRPGPGGRSSSRIETCEALGQSSGFTALDVPAHAFGWAPWRSVIWSVGLLASVSTLSSAPLSVPPGSCAGRDCAASSSARCRAARRGR